MICSCTFNSKQNDASINFNNNMYDFGIITKGKEANCKFFFSNPGNTNLIIYDVRTSCGCLFLLLSIQNNH